VTGPVRHLYAHLPFCASRCGYCDFVTLVGRREGHAGYVDALLAELSLEQETLADPLETVFLGGGTPTFTEPDELARLLAALPRAQEVTVEANPETVTPEVASVLRREGVTRISLGAQSFQPTLLAVLERRATPGSVRAAFSHLREAGFENLSLDLIYGIPGQSQADLALDLAQAIALGPEHLSCYELEAKPGTRFTVAHGRELSRQADAMEGYFELVVETLVGAGFRWYETANFCRPGREARHNLGYWRGEDYLGLGIGAVSTVAGVRWRNRPSLTGYLSALARGERPPRDKEVLGPEVAHREWLMLGLRLDEPLALARVEGAVDRAGLARMERLGLAERRAGGLVLTRRGRFLGGGVTAELMAESPAESPAKSTIR
jgi:putative oxygen-independent coproporphyrinogen III oxidase